MTKVVCARVLEHAGCRRDETLVVTAGRLRERFETSKGAHERHEGVKSVGVVEWLCAESHVQRGSAEERRAVVDVRVRLDDEDELLARVVEIEFNLVGRGTDRFVARELELFNKVLVRVLSHAPALIGVKEDVVDVERSSNERLLVSDGLFDRCSGSQRPLPGNRAEIVDGEKNLIRRAKLEVDPHLVVLKSDQRQSKTRVPAEPELERDV